MNQLFTRTIRWMACCVLCCCMVGCQTDEVVGPIIISTVDTEFTIDFWEEVSLGRHELNFLLQTVENQDCGNATIGIRYTNQSRQLTFDITDILQPEMCDPVPAPARKEVSAGLFTSGTRYDVEISLKGTVANSGQLEVLDDRYLFHMSSENGFRLLHDELLKIPAAAIWGAAVAFTDIGENAIENMLQELDLISEFYLLPTGNYGHFTLGQDQMTFRRQLPQGVHTPILRRYNPNDMADLRELLDRYRAAYPDDIYLQLTSGTGYVF